MLNRQRNEETFVIKYCCVQVLYEVLLKDLIKFHLHSVQYLKFKTHLFAVSSVKERIVQTGSKRYKNTM